MQTGVAICGEPPGEPGVLGRRLWDLPFDDSSKVDWQAHRTQLEWRPRFRDLELRYLDRAGKPCGVSLSGEPMLDAKGLFRGYCGIARDTTERRQPDDALRRNEARFRNLVEIAADWYWEQDADFRFTSLVGAGTACIKGVLGKTLREVPGMVPDEQEWARHRSELDAQWSFCDFQCVVELPGGKLVYYLVSGAPVYDDAGIFTGFHGTGLDITQ